MSFRRTYYTKPSYIDSFLPKKQPDFIPDFAQLERKADYYRRESGIRRSIVMAFLVIFFLSLSAIYGYYSLVPGAAFPTMTLPKPATKENVALIKPTDVEPTKVVESVSLTDTEKTYEYTIVSGDSYARLVKRAVNDYAEDNSLTLTNRELNQTVYYIISGLQRTPLHPGDLFLIDGTTISEALMIVRADA